MKKMKKLLGMLLVLCTLLVLLPMTVSAAEIIDSGECGSNLTWTLDDTGKLTISGTGEMSDYKMNAYYASQMAPWKQYRGDITTIVVKKGVTRIGDYAFFNCENVTSVSLPNGLLELGEGCFSQCRNLKTLVLPDTLEVIEAGAFGTMTSLTEITIPAATNTIADYIFSGNDALKHIWVDEKNETYSSDDAGVFFNKDKTVLIRCPFAYEGNYTIPAGVVTIGASAFNMCDELTGVEIPEGVVAIERCAFMMCKKLKNVSFPSTLKAIYQEAFYECAITSITIPDNMHLINSYAFLGCWDLTEVTFLGNPPGNDTFILDADAVTAYYPKSSRWWSGDRMASYGEHVTWVPYTVRAPKVEATSVASTGKNKLTWNAVEGAAKYQVFVRTGKTGSYKYLTATANTSITHTKGVAGQTYYYYVKAVDQYGDKSVNSNVVYRTCDLARPVVSVKNVASSGKNQISWEAVDGAVEYQVYYSTSKNGSYNPLYTTSKTSLTHSSAVAGKTYYYKVKAVAENTSANSAFSTVKACVCGLKRPVPSVALNASGKPVVKWGKVSGATGYRVYIYNANGKLLKTVDVSGTKLTHSSAEAGKTYKYRVVALHSNSEANSAKSAVVSVKSK